MAALRSGWAQACACYLVAYVNFYKGAGVNVIRLGFLNEPELS
jgi:O-glycosyl hydrolase